VGGWYLSELNYGPGIMSGVFSALGLVLALLGLWQCSTTARRIFLWCVVAMAALFLALTITKWG